MSDDLPIFYRIDAERLRTFDFSVTYNGLTAVTNKTTNLVVKNKALTMTMLNITGTIVVDPEGVKVSFHQGADAMTMAEAEYVYEIVIADTVDLGYAVSLLQGPYFVQEAIA